MNLSLVLSFTSIFLCFDITRYLLHIFNFFHPCDELRSCGYATLSSLGLLLAFRVIDERVEAVRLAADNREGYVQTRRAAFLLPLFKLNVKETYHTRWMCEGKSQGSRVQMEIKVLFSTMK